ncbi:MAG: tol-pal system-associated acyl-CoA thioesterase [Chromatiales bacterium]
MPRTRATPTAEFVWRVRVYYEDTDAGGVVYYANYLRFMERARTEWLRQLGFEQDQLLERDRIVFPVRRAVVDYVKPARFNDQLEVRTRIAALGRASIDFEHEIMRDGGRALCRARVSVVCVDAGSFRPRPIPDPILAQISSL